MTDCIETQGYRNRQGYGQVKRQGRSWPAHRWAWMQANGPIPDGMIVCHACDNPPCIRIDHLFLGTNADNSADMVAKGRAARGEGHNSRLHPESVPHGDAHGRHTKPERSARGSRQGLAKLTEADVPVIRTRRTSGDALQAIAADFGVTSQSVWAVVHRKTWRHVA